MTRLNWRDASLQLVWISPLISAVYLHFAALALKPMFNALPTLDQRAGVIYASFSVASAFLLLGLPTASGQRAVPRYMRPVFLCGAATAAALSAVGARYVASFATRASPAYITGGKVPYLDEFTTTLAPNFAALASLVFLGAGVVVPLLALASPPKPQGDDQKARLARGMAHSLPFVMTYLFEGMMAHYEGRIDNPEQGMCIISGAIVLLSLILGAFPEAHPIVATPVVVEKVEEKVVKPTKATKGGKKKATVEVEESVEVVEKPPVVVRKSSNSSPFTSLLLRAVPIAIAAMAFRFHPEAPFEKAGIRVLSSNESISGRVVVADSSVTSENNATHSLRYLRADHSILGGVWIRNRETAEGNTVDLGDSIFAAFPLQEIAVLTKPEDAKGSALVLGLGAGIGAVYYGRRGYEVDVVEYDEEVVAASLQHFGLARYPPAKVHVVDGADFVREAAAAVVSEEAKESAKQWDIIVQDVFSAGQLPVQMFTVEFWKDVKTILKPDGVVVMNFPGATMTASSLAVVNSLIQVFPNCRVFNDAFTQKQAKKDLGNLVFICAETRPEFREPTEADTVNSPLREQVYSGFLTSEMQLKDVAPPPEMAKRLILRREGGNRYPGWDRQISADSFKAIEGLLSPAQWRAY